MLFLITACPWLVLSLRERNGEHLTALTSPSILVLLERSLPFVRPDLQW